jgi:hypothetical protein
LIAYERDEDLQGLPEDSPFFLRYCDLLCSSLAIL